MKRKLSRNELIGKTVKNSKLGIIYNIKSDHMKAFLRLYIVNNANAFDYGLWKIDEINSNIADKRWVIIAPTIKLHKYLTQ